jgi:O-antigen ligase
MAAGGVCLLVASAPFETLEPLVRMPGQNISSVEAVLIGVLVIAALSVVVTRAMPIWQTPLTWPWIALIAAGTLAAVVAPHDRGNALHMAGRFGLALLVFVLTVNAANTRDVARAIALAFTATGVVVGLLMVGEFLRVDAVERALRPFHSGLAVVGSQVRATGPFQYPTIASMYLEIAFALTLGLLVDERTRSSFLRLAGLIVCLVVIAEGVLVSFTRAGIITMTLSLVTVGGARMFRRGLSDAALKAVAAVAVVFAVQVVTSRSAEAMRLRLTSEGQDMWYRAAIDAPPSLSLNTGQMLAVPLSIENLGRIPWDSSAATPIFLSYHWIASDSDRVVIWEGERTRFDAPIAPGQRVALRARVRAPGTAGTYRLVWDLEAVKHLWFSTEPDATVTMTDTIVSGPFVHLPVAHGGPRTMPRPIARPGRFVLWRAAAALFKSRPVTGIGADNFRLQYGPAAHLSGADARVHSNNTYIELLVGMGLVGAVALVWLARAAAEGVWRALGAATGLELGVAAAVAAIAVHGLVDSFLSFTPTYIAMAVVSGLLVTADGKTEAHAYRV